MAGLCLLALPAGGALSLRWGHRVKALWPQEREGGVEPLPLFFCLSPPDESLERLSIGGDLPLA